VMIQLSIVAGTATIRMSDSSANLSLLNYTFTLK
jgi:hypothetical protein